MASRVNTFNLKISHNANSQSQQSRLLPHNLMPEKKFKVHCVKAHPPKCISSLIVYIIKYSA